jgi:phosphoribosylformylglycinamidine synthase
MVGTDTLLYGTADAAVVRIRGTGKAIALKTDCNPRYVYLNPYRGAQIAVAESARNVVCVGAKPIAITNCLNFGNPKKPEMFWQFKEAVRGIADACRAFETPVTGGNVSFYNESPDGPVYPTPVIGMLGLIDDLRKTLSAEFRLAGDLILLLGETAGHTGGSEYLKIIHGKVEGDAPPLDLRTEKRLQEALLALAGRELLHSAHDLSEGGLAVGLAECVIWSGEHGSTLGAEISLAGVGRGIRRDFRLFGEDQSRILISISPGSLGNVQSVLDRFGVSGHLIGSVGGSELRIDGDIRVSVEEMEGVYGGALERILGIEPASL